MIAGMTCGFVRALVPLSTRTVPVICAQAMLDLLMVRSLAAQGVRDPIPQFGSPTRPLAGKPYPLRQRQGRKAGRWLHIARVIREKLERAGRLVVSAAVALARLIDAIRQIR